jgi:hypothetical protein
MSLAVSLDDKYTAEDGRVFLTGIQALVRLPMTQMRRDRAAGLEHRGLHLGLPGLAAWGLRPAAPGGEEVPRSLGRHIPAGAQ